MVLADGQGVLVESSADWPAGLAETWQSQPKLDPEDDHDPTDSSHNISRYCNNYSRVLDSLGNNILKGLIAFEGCVAISFTEAGMPSRHDPLLAKAISSLLLISATMDYADIGFCMDLKVHQPRGHSIRQDSLWLCLCHTQVTVSQQPVFSVFSYLCLAHLAQTQMPSKDFSGLPAAAITIPDSTFLTFMDCANGAPGKSLMQLAYEGATGQNVQCIELSSGNHYALNDWNPVSAPHQVRNPTMKLTDP